MGVLKGWFVSLVITCSFNVIITFKQIYSINLLIFNFTQATKRVGIIVDKLVAVLFQRII